MNAETQRIAIAEACGWHECRCSEDCGHTEWYQNGIASTCQKMPPDYLNDLNAIHSAEKVLDAQGKQRDRVKALWEVCGTMEDRWNDLAGLIGAPAGKRAEAVLKALNLWKE